MPTWQKRRQGTLWRLQRQEEPRATILGLMKALQVQSLSQGHQI